MRYIFSICLIVGSLGGLLSQNVMAQSVNHADIVLQVAAERAPDRTLEGALDFTLRVVARINQQFPSEHVGLLEKVAGENIVAYAGTFVSAGRIAYPNQQLFKLLTDVPATNGPQWRDDGFAQIGGYMRGYLAVTEVAPPLPPVVAPSAPPVVILPPAVDLNPVLSQQAIDHALLLELQKEQAATRQDIAEFRAAVRSRWAAVMGSPVVKYGLTAVAGWVAAWRMVK